MSKFVSICTPTFNRRYFFQALIEMIRSQDYPHTLLEWVIGDDGSDSIEDLIKDIKFIKVRYFRIQKQQTLGWKRNFLNQKANGDIIVYFDDDDYYPPNRISNGVKLLTQNPSYKIAGSSLMHIFYHHLNEIYKCGPYGKNHATAATFIFHKNLLEETHFDNESLVGEEKFFLKNHSIPILQLDSKSTILVIAHEQNSYDKKKLLENLEQSKMARTDLKLDNFIKYHFQNLNLIEFYKKDLHVLLKNYSLGSIDNKKEIKDYITEKEKKSQMIKENLEKYKNNVISNKKTNEEYENKLKQKTILIQKLLVEIKELKEELSALKNNR